MAHAFYPMVDNEGKGDAVADTHADKLSDMSELTPKYAARIAVYDDASAAPRVVVVEPSDVRNYLEEITATVVRLAQEQGSDIPFTVIREIVENFIHAYFIEPTISILDEGCTIRFSDQGPGIKQKDVALQFGTSSANKEMKQYIRGVGSGLPYAQQYMEDKGGRLTIEDNIDGGTIVTISTAEEVPEATDPSPYMTGQTYLNNTVSPAQVPQANPYGYPQAAAYPQAAPYPGIPQGYPPTAYPGYGWQAGYPQVQSVPQQIPGYPPMTQQMPQTAYPQQMQTVPTPQPQLSLELSERAKLALSYLKTHEAIGTVEMVRDFGGSQPTWSRELKALEEAGLIRKQKGGQKRFLTEAGRMYITNAQL